MKVWNMLHGIANVILKAGNIDLYRQLIEVMQLTLEMQEEIERLNDENKELKKRKDLRPLIQRHLGSFITLKNENPQIRYCAHCWDVEEKIIQLTSNEDNGHFICPHCKTEGVFNRNKNKSTRQSSYAGRNDSIFR